MTTAPKSIEIDELPELPESWEWARFGTLLGELRNGISAKPELTPPGLSILRISAVRSGRVSLNEHRFLPHGVDLLAEYGLRDGDLLFTRYNGSLDLLGVCGMVRGLGNASVLYPDKLMRVRFDHDYVLPAYAELFFQSAGARDRLTAQSRSSAGQQGVSGADIKSQPFALPPLEEQRRLVEAIETALSRVDAARDHLSRVPPILKRFRQAVLAAACSGRLTRDIVPEGELPLNWQRRRVDSLFSVRTGGTPSRKVKEYFIQGSIPWIKTGELRNTDITSVEEYITPRAVDESNAKVFPPGTILIAMYGEGKTRGQVGRLTFPAATNQACAALINASLPLETQKYVFIYLLSQYETLRAEAVGGNQPNLNLSIIKEWEIPIPPAEEQPTIVERVNALLTLANAIDRRVADATCCCDKLTQSIIAKAFRGELVPTEAELARREGREYEPASVLLERIKKERNSGTPSKGTRQRTRSNGTLASAKGKA